MGSIDTAILLDINVCDTEAILASCALCNHVPVVSDDKMHASSTIEGTILS